MSRRVEEMDVEDRQPPPAGRFLKRSTMIAIGGAFATTIIAVFLITFLVTYYNAPGKTVKEDPVITTTTTTTRLPETTTTTTTATTTTTTATTTTTEAPSNTSVYRLPKDFQPELYELTVKTRFTPATEPQSYEAEEKLYFTCSRSTNKLVLHAKDLDIVPGSIEISVVGSITITYSGLNYTLDDKTEFIIIEMADRPSGQAYFFEKNKAYVLSAKFMANLRKENVGFFKTSYKTSTGQTKWLVASQMEPVDARRAFICFDEPNMKAKFKLTVYHDPSVHAISNMAIEKISNLDDWKITYFEQTPVRMSSYLLALIISDHECKTGTLSSNVLTRTCAPAEELVQMDYCLDVAQNALKFLENRYGIAYPLKKLDHIALPEFNFGGMENYGAITYLTDLVYKNDKTPMADEQVVVRITAHEVNHQWFGNLVTAQWWDDLWLNEGFTRYIDFVGADALRPHWNMLTQQTEHLFQIMEEDAKYETRAVVIYIDGQPDLIEGTIDRIITYGKGSMIVRMLNHMLGEGTFSRAITSYLKKHQYSNANQFDLWTAIQESAQQEGKLWDIQDFGKFMSTWTVQEGHPVVTIKQLNATYISIKQNRFVYDSLRYTPLLSETSKWNIPFTFSVEKVNSVNPQTVALDKEQIHNSIILLKAEEDEKIIRLSEPIDPSNQFILANMAAFGIYRVNYDSAHWESIIKQLKSNIDAIPEAIRGQLVYDSFALSRAGLQDATLPLKLTYSFISREIDFLPLTAFLSSTKFYKSILDSTDLNEGFKAFMQSQVDHIYSKIGWSKVDNEAWTDGILRDEVLNTACSVDLSTCVEKALEHFSAWKANPSNNKIPTAHRKIVYCTAVRNGDSEDWQFLMDEYQKPDNSEDQSNILYGLSCPATPELLQRYLTFIKTMDKGYISNIKNALVNPSGFLATWQFIKENWPSIYTKNSTSGFKDLIFTIANKLTTDAQLNDFVTFFNDTDSSELRKLVDSALKYARSNVAWFSKNKMHLNDWFSQNQLKLNFRLSEDIKPVLYELEVRPYICDSDSCGNKAFSFEGKMKMHLKCSHPTRIIRFHINELDVEWNRSSLSSTVDKDVSLTNSIIVYDNQKEWFSIYLKKACTADAMYELIIVYNGKISEKLNGFYRGSYVEAGKTQYMASTDFQPANARKAFPCLDEPLQRSEFIITIIRHKDFTNVLSNAKLNFTKPHTDPDWFVDSFEKTVSMSTYLVAFSISKLDSIQKTTDKYKIDIEVVARPDAIKNGDGDYALSEAAKIIDYYVDYFDMPYPLTKSTQLAVPDYNGGAMENWGLVIYRESSLLYNPASDTALNKRRVSVVVAHELAHQWFGNLVTPVWWNDLWLNEGFASWVEYLGTTLTNPSWQDLDYFVLERLSTYVEDSLESSHPISVEVNEPSEISAIFDSISYDKGSYIIRMMNAFLTVDTFKKGVSAYLKKYEFGNAVQDNLWEELTKRAHFDKTLDASLTVKDIMDTWTLQMGYPVVQVDCDTTARKLTINQKWFLLNPLGNMLQPANQNEYHKYQWFIPFTYTTQSERDFDFNKKVNWIKPNQPNSTISLTLTNDNEWIIANNKRAGFYRVNYNTENWRRLAAQLNADPTKIDVISRCQLIDDAFNLGRAEQLDQTLYLDLLKYIIVNNETESFPLLTAVDGLDYIGRMVSGEAETRTLLGKFVVKLFTPSYNLNKWSSIPDSQITQVYIQLDTLKVMCLYGNQDCIDQAKLYYENGVDGEGNSAMLNNFKTVIYQTVIRYGTDEFWQLFYERALQTESGSERLRMIQSLTATRSETLLRRILDISANQTVVKNQDRSSIITQAAGNILVNKRIAFNYIDEKWEELVDIFRGSSYTLSNLVLKTTENFNTQDDLNALLRFAEKHPDLASAATAVKQAQENIETNINWMNKNKKDIHDWLTANVQ